MNQLNNFILEGTLVGNPEYKENAAGGQDVSRFVLASNRTYKNAKGEKENEVSYFDVEALGLVSKRINCVKAGQGMRIAGRMKQNRWIDKDGKTQSKVVFIAENIEFKIQTIQKAKTSAKTKDIDYEMEM